MKTDTTAQTNDEICVNVTVEAGVSGELDTTNNKFEYCYRVVNSYDPNIKLTTPEIVKPGYEAPFTYTVYFQNIGNAPAFNIKIKDTLDPNLNLETFQIVNASHDFNFNLSGKNLFVSFPFIMLPDSMSDPEGSIGFIQYKVSPKSGMTEGSVIKNKAYIYFDYNEPIITNTTENLFTAINSINNIEKFNAKIYPNPNKGIFIVESRGHSTIEVFNIYGHRVYEESHVKTKSIIDFSNRASGLYFVKLTATDGSKVIYRLIKE